MTSTHAALRFLPHAPQPERAAPSRTDFAFDDGSQVDDFLREAGPELDDDSTEDGEDVALDDDDGRAIVVDIVLPASTTSMTSTRAAASAMARAATVAAPILDRDAKLRRDVYHGLVHCLVSNQKLWGTVDVGEVKEVMEPTLAALPRAPLELGPLWRYMLAKGTPRAIAAETLLSFASRAPRWHVLMEVPTEAVAAAHEDVPRPKATASSTSARRASPAKAVRAVGVGLVIALCAALALVVARHAPAEQRTVPADAAARVTAALSPLCKATTLVDDVVQCTSDIVTLARGGAIRKRRAAAEQQIGVRVLFVDDVGAPLALPPPL